MNGPTLRTDDEMHDEVAHAFLGAATEPPGRPDDPETAAFIATWKALRSLTQLPEHLNRLRPHLNTQSYADALLDLELEELIGRTGNTADTLLARVL